MHANPTSRNSHQQEVSMATPIHPATAWLLVASIVAAAGLSESQSDGLDASASNRPAAEIRHPDSGEMLVLFPHSYAKHPGPPSPWKAPDGREILVGRTGDGRFTLLPVTVENGAPMDWSKGRFNKGRQVDVGEKDFPELAANGLHDNDSLDRITTITGRSLDELTRLGRPNGLSSSGFFAADEDVISVLKGDNALVRKLGLTHSQMARPLFHVWNAILLELQHGSRQGRAPRFCRAFSPIEYNGSKVVVKAEGTKGFQQSLFNDEIRGTAIITIARELTPGEAGFLQEEYAHLSMQQKDELIARLTRMQTGEMAPYYVMRYGFYEGHTPWRVDPIAIAFIFGLCSLDEIEAAFPGSLHESLTGHFVACPRRKRTKTTSENDENDVGLNTVRHKNCGVAKL
jgi:hypothetical protein